MRKLETANTKPGPLRDAVKLPPSIISMILYAASKLPNHEEVVIDSVNICANEFWRFHAAAAIPFLRRPCHRGGSPT